MARDIFHPIAREALEKEGWTITHDPYLVKLKGRAHEVDLAAEQLVAAEKDAVKIAVEVKSFVSQSISQQTFFMEEGTKLIVAKFNINLAVFNPATKRIEQWIPSIPTS
jgi:XisH protein